MFDVRSGWLHYAPFSSYFLPRIVPCYGGDEDGRIGGSPLKAKFTGPESEGVRFQKPLYRLEWPGEMQVKAGSENWGDTVPASIMQHWEGNEHLRVHFLGGGHAPQWDYTSYSLRMILHDNCDTLPREMPPAVAYHLAVNRLLYYPAKTGTPGNYVGCIEHPVGSLPPERVGQVLDGRFALQQSDLDALIYLKWLAETHRYHPLWTGFDTLGRELLASVSARAAQVFFKLLKDHLYDSKTTWWARGDDRNHWWRLATYLHWVGRTGDGALYRPSHADLEDEEFVKAMPDVAKRHQEFLGNNHNRHLRHERGREAETGEQGPAL